MSKQKELCLVGERKEVFRGLHLCGELDVFSLTSKHNLPQQYPEKNKILKHNPLHAPHAQYIEYQLVDQNLRLGGSNEQGEGYSWGQFSSLALPTLDMFRPSLVYICVSEQHPSMAILPQWHDQQYIHLPGSHCPGMLRFQLTKTMCFQGTHVAISDGAIKSGGCREHTKSLCFCSEI